MAFDSGSFKMTYVLDGAGEDDVTIRTWNMEQPFRIAQYGPYGGSFRAEIIQRRNGRHEPWFFVPKVTLAHMDTTRPNIEDDGVFTEPTVTLPRTATFDDAIALIRKYVQAKVNRRRWVGKTFEDEWWLPTEAEIKQALASNTVWI